MGRLAPPRPLTNDDDREKFDCGRNALNDWLRQHAWRNQRDGTSRTSIVSDIENSRIAGFISLMNGQIERAWLPRPLERNKPDPIPIMLLGQLAVDREYQGLGIGKSMLRYALDTALQISAEVGCFGVLTHPLDDTVRDFYRAYGFMVLPGDPKHSMLVRVDEILKNHP